MSDQTFKSAALACIENDENTAIEEVRKAQARWQDTKSSRDWDLYTSACATAITLSAAYRAIRDLEDTHVCQVEF